MLDAAIIGQLAKRTNEPDWVTNLRTQAWERHAQLSWPHKSDEIWRRTDVSVFDPARQQGLGVAADVLHGVKVSDGQLAGLTQPLGSEFLSARLDGAWISQQLSSGVSIRELAQAAHEQPELLRPILEADGLTLAEQKLTSLNAAFHHDALVIRIPDGFQREEPIRLVQAFSVTPQAALFPMTVIIAGEGSRVSIVEEHVGLSNGDAENAHTINGRVELVIQRQATVRYCRIQRWAPGAQEFLLQRAGLQEGAQLDMVNLNIGGRVTKSHIIAKLLGAHATSRVYGFVFGHGVQHVDFHSLQDHQAPHTTSDLLYKAALKDASRLIYTGLIRIAKSAKQTNAYQANHNLLLSQRSTAETVPMLEILADDVACKHGATIGPVDEEQLFYLMSRGIPRALAERILVMGFVQPIIDQVPGEALQQRLLQELEGSLNRVTSEE